MATAYVDSSALLAIAFNEEGGVDARRQLAGYSRLVSSNLLEAETRVAFAREGRAFEGSSLYGIEWVLPERALTGEIARVLSAGYVKGADAWHLAAALYATLELDAAAFITFDRQQRSVAEALGFQV